MRVNIVTAILWLVFTEVAIASDMAREQRMADEVVDAILDGDAVYLKSDGHDFLNIYTEAENAKGAVIILHGRGVHPDWEDVAHPLRVGLVESGWNTLSMQMPVLEKTTKYYDYVPIFKESFPRIESGVSYLQRQGNNKIVLVAHSCSVHMTMAWVDAGRLKNVDAYIGIGMGATDYKQPMAKPLALDKLTIPVFDVYGGNEYPAVLKTAEDRWAMIKRAGNSKSKQQVVPNADHYFTDQGDALLKVVSNWLDTL